MLKKKNKLIEFVKGTVSGFLIAALISFLFSEETRIAFLDELKNGACYYQDIRFFSWTTTNGEECISFLKNQYPFLMLKVDSEGHVHSLLLHDDKKQLAQYSFGSREPSLLVNGIDHDSFISGIVSEGNKQWTNYWYRLDNIENQITEGKVYYYDLNFDSVADVRHIVNEQDEIINRAISVDNNWMDALSIGFQEHTAIIQSEKNEVSSYTFDDAGWKFCPMQKPV